MFRKILLTIPLLFAGALTFGVWVTIASWHVQMNDLMAASYYLGIPILFGTILSWIVRVWFGKKGVYRFYMVGDALAGVILVYWIGAWAYYIFIEKSFPFDQASIAVLVIFITLFLLDMLHFFDMRHEIRKLRYV